MVLLAVQVAAVEIAPAPDQVKKAQDYANNKPTQKTTTVSADNYAQLALQRTRVTGPLPGGTQGEFRIQSKTDTSVILKDAAGNTYYISKTDFTSGKYSAAVSSLGTRPTTGPQKSTDLDVEGSKIAVSPLSQADLANLITSTSIMKDVRGGEGTVPTGIIHLDDYDFFRVDANGNIYYYRASDNPAVPGTGYPTGYIMIKSADGKSQFFNPETITADGKPTGQAYDPDTGLMFEGGDKTPWRQVRSDTRYAGQIEVSKMYGLDIGMDVYAGEYVDQLTKKTMYDYFYVDAKGNIQRLSAEELQIALAQTFGKDWANQYASWGKTTEEMINNAQKRRNIQAFWGAFFEGSESLIYQSVTDKINRKYWADVTKEWTFLQSAFFTPQTWEVEICKMFISNDKDIPSSAQIGYDAYGPHITMNLFAEKENFPIANLTLYQVSWLVAPLADEVEYRVCLGSCTPCKIIQDWETVSKGDTDNGFATKYRNITLQASKVSICYYETTEVDGEEQKSELLSFTQPIVFENYNPDDDSGNYGTGIVTEGQGGAVTPPEEEEDESW